MFRIHAVESLPRVKHAALLRIVKRKVAVQVAVPAALVAVVPEENRRVIDVPLDHFAHEQATVGRVVRVMPAAEFIQHVEAQLVAGLEERLVGRVVRHPHRVHVQLLD